MKLAIVTDEQLKQEFRSKKMSTDINIFFFEKVADVPADANIIVDLLFVPARERISLLKQFLPRPVFINAVTDTLAVIGQPFIRINAWPTFLKREMVEVAMLPQQEKVVELACRQLGWHYQVVPDLPGMISPRIAGMIINEAYFTLEKKISTKEEIDTAMKLGTNYPYGPFEWGELIGLKKIYEMLMRLNNGNNLYEVSAVLKRQIVAIEN